MGNSHQRLLAAAALVLTMSAIVALVVLSPLVWGDGPSSEQAAEAVPALDEVAEVVASPKPAPSKPGPDKSGPNKPVGARLASPVNPAIPRAAGAAKVRPQQRPVVSDKKSQGKAKGHEKKALGSKKTGKHDHHAQGAAGKGHGKGKKKDRDRAPARARG